MPLNATTTLSFFLVALLLAFTPGPDNLFVLMQSASHGRRAGMWVVLGLCTGLVGHTMAVACGLASLFAASRAAFTVLKISGAAYLASLAWQAFRASPAPNGEATDLDPRSGGEDARLYLRGVVMNLTNPKVLLFFLAFLPQFLTPEKGRFAAQVLWLGLLFILATFVAFGLIAQFAGFLRERFTPSERSRKILNQLTAIVFLALAMRLALGQR